MSFGCLQILPENNWNQFYFRYHSRMNDQIYLFIIWMNWIGIPKLLFELNWPLEKDCFGKFFKDFSLKQKKIVDGFFLPLELSVTPAELATVLHAITSAETFTASAATALPPRKPPQPRLPLWTKTILTKMKIPCVLTIDANRPFHFRVPSPSTALGLMQFAFNYVLMCC